MDKLFHILGVLTVLYAFLFLYNMLQSISGRWAASWLNYLLDRRSSLAQTVSFHRWHYHANVRIMLPGEFCNSSSVVL